ncbi:hypothetical protein FB451DRAFT_1288338 [Mycena latifolia]|nr:hypothetical protein FB451DRAFT_1288338 [Mycena latifolia]
MSQPRTISYALTVPAIVLDIVVIALMGYAASGAVQDQLATDGFGPIGPYVCLTAAALETLYLAIALALLAAVPTLAVILLNSLFLIPCYLAGIIGLGNTIDGGVSGACNHESPCRRPWHVLGALEIAAMALQIFGLVLALIDLVRVIHIRRVQNRGRTQK